jgi:rapamycin-insensitive companion of mTOR
MLYRALHTISSQRYRLPVRRYVLDLFNIELDDHVVKDLQEHAIKLRIKPTSGEATVRASRAMSVVMLPPRYARISDSDESMSEDDEPVDVEKHPVIKTRPQSQVVGF